MQSSYLAALLEGEATYAGLLTEIVTALRRRSFNRV
jgi:hypothetical protein